MRCLMYVPRMKTHSGWVFLGFALLIGNSNAHAESLSLSEVRDYANQAISQYNNALPADGSLSTERLFEGYRQISIENCRQTPKKIKCSFDVTESSDRDADVYTPNTLNVIVNRSTGKMTVSIEWGC